MYIAEGSITRSKERVSVATTGDGLGTLIVLIWVHVTEVVDPGGSDGRLLQRLEQERSGVQYTGLRLQRQKRQGYQV